VLDDLGLAPALRGLARSLDERGGFRVELRLVGELADLPPDVETLLFRVAQEGLTNALKHSGAAGAELELTRRGDRLQLAVIDHGKGCDARARSRTPVAAATGIGLRSVRDRIEAYGGAFRFESTSGAGARLTIELTLSGDGP
jgi:signal transduction histidine kinase